MTAQYLKNIRRLNLACKNRDAPAARRIVMQIERILSPSDPPNLRRIEACVRTYAAEIRGWEIPKP